MLACTKIDSSKALEFTMRDSIGAIEELSLNALFSMNSGTFEVISIQPEERQLSPSPLSLV